MMSVFRFWIDGFTGAWDILSNLFSRSWSETWTAIKDFFGTLWTNIKAMFSNAINGILGFMPGFVKKWLGITDDVSTGADDVSDSLDTTTEKMETVTTTADDTAEAMGESGVAGAAGTAAGAFDDLGEAAENAARQECVERLEALDWRAEQRRRSTDPEQDVDRRCHALPAFQDLEIGALTNIDAIKKNLRTVPTVLTDEVAPELTNQTPWQSFQGNATNAIQGVNAALSSETGLAGAFSGFASGSWQGSASVDR